MYLLMFFTSIIFSFEINLVEFSLLESPSIHTREMKSCVTYKKNRVLGACLIFLPTCCSSFVSILILCNKWI